MCRIVAQKPSERVKHATSATHLLERIPSTFKVVLSRFESDDGPDDPLPDRVPPDNKHDKTRCILPGLSEAGPYEIKVPGKDVKEGKSENIMYQDKPDREYPSLQVRKMPEHTDHDE